MNEIVTEWDCHWVKSCAVWIVLWRLWDHWVKDHTWRQISCMLTLSDACPTTLSTRSAPTQWRENRPTTVSLGSATTQWREKWKTTAEHELRATRNADDLSVCRMLNKKHRQFHHCDIQGTWQKSQECQHHFEEADNLGDLMRLWIRSRVQNSVLRLFTWKRIGHLEWQGAWDKACVCGTPLSFRIIEPLSDSFSHNPSPLESSKKKKHEVHVDVLVMLLCMWMCVCVLLLCLWWLLLSWSWSVLWLCCVCLMGVMCPLSCVHCNVFNVDVLLLITPVLWFFTHWPRSKSRHVRFLNFSEITKIITRNYPTRALRAQKHLR